MHVRRQDEAIRLAVYGDVRASDETATAGDAAKTGRVSTIGHHCAGYRHSAAISIRASSMARLPADLPSLRDDDAARAGVVYMTEQFIRLQSPHSVRGAAA
jgi:hypothetical protein